MSNQDDVANSLEQLLESLIKMVGRANQNANTLQKQIVQLNQQNESLQLRISQLECLIKSHIVEKELDNTPRMFLSPAQTHSTSEAHDNIPAHY